MKSIPEIIKEIEEEIRVRKELLQKMVGTLYPAIISDEIHKLNQALKQLT